VLSNTAVVYVVANHSLIFMLILVHLHGRRRDVDDVKSVVVWATGVYQVYEYLVLFTPNSMVS